MSVKEVENFFNEMATNERLQKDMKIINNEIIFDIEKSKDKKIEYIIQESGCNISSEDLKQYEKGKEIDNDASENASGGKTICMTFGGGNQCFCTIAGYGKTGCYCPGIGYGK